MLEFDHVMWSRKVCKATLIKFPQQVWAEDDQFITLLSTSIMRGASLLLLVAALAGTVVGQQSSAKTAATGAVAGGQVGGQVAGDDRGGRGGGRVDALEEVCTGKKVARETDQRLDPFS